MEDSHRRAVGSTAARSVLEALIYLILRQIAERKSQLQNSTEYDIIGTEKIKTGFCF